MADIAFSRIEMLAPQAPPASEIGWIGWARANLFSSWLNAILTVVSVAAVAWVILHVYPWFAHAVWNATLYQVLEPLTESSSATGWFATETGLFLAATSVLAAVLWWRRFPLRATPSGTTP